MTKHIAPENNLAKESRKGMGPKPIPDLGFSRSVMTGIARRKQNSWLRPVFLVLVTICSMAAWIWFRKPFAGLDPTQDHAPISLFLFLISFFSVASIVFCREVLKLVFQERG